MRIRNRARAGTTVVECAVVYPVVFFLLLALVIGALGVFRYQQVAHLAREGARYASVHGQGYEKATGNPAATPEDVFNEAVVPNAVGIDPDQLSYSVTWDRTNAVYHSDVVNGKLKPTRNIVRVTVSYQWLPGGLLGDVRVSSTSDMPMCY